jgi:CheY-like chemotaxis protein
MLILLVDDNLDNRNVAERQLVHLGYQVHPVESGKIALDVLAESGDQYDLILMDCQMPVMDGYETTRKIREMEGDVEQRIPIVALTASARGDVYKKYEAAGMDDLIFKPMTLEQLSTVIERWRKPGTS